MSEQSTWVIGRGGLLGSSIVRRVGTTYSAPPIPWNHPTRAANALVDQLGRFLDAVHDSPWAIYWAAGASVIGSSAQTLASDTAVLGAFIGALRSRDLPPGGVFSYASSAAVYGGRPGAPYSEFSVPAAASTYAEAKLRQEGLVASALDGRLPHVIARISTLYGPGQNLNKRQGLISTMCLQAARRQPVQVFVPIDTLRDYLYVDDAASQILGYAHHARRAGQVETTIRIVADGRAVTVAQLAKTVVAVAHRRIGIHQLPARDARGHVRDLRVAPAFRHELGPVTRSPLSAGIRSVYEDVLRRITHPTQV